MALILREIEIKPQEQLCISKEQLDKKECGVPISRGC